MSENSIPQSDGSPSQGQSDSHRATDDGMPEPHFAPRTFERPNPLDTPAEVFPGHSDLTDDSARQFDYLVFFGGRYTYRIPCGVCGTNDPTDPDHAERVRLQAHYGVKSPALRETVRRHLELALQRMHPNVEVR